MEPVYTKSKSKVIYQVGDKVQIKVGYPRDGMIGVLAEQLNSNPKKPLWRIDFAGITTGPALYTPEKFRKLRI